MDGNKLPSNWAVNTDLFYANSIESNTVSQLRPVHMLWQSTCGHGDKLFVSAEVINECDNTRRSLSYVSYFIIENNLQECLCPVAIREIVFAHEAGC